MATKMIQIVKLEKSEKKDNFPLSISPMTRGLEWMYLLLLIKLTFV